jgi:hypothetical protein
METWNQVLSIFVAMGIRDMHFQGHGEIDKSFFDNLAYLGLWDR